MGMMLLRGSKACRNESSARMANSQFTVIYISIKEENRYFVSVLSRKNDGAGLASYCIIMASP